MGLKERIGRVEEELAPGDGRCVLFVDEAEDGHLTEIPKCPKGRELSEDLHECGDCRLVPDRDKTRIRMIDVDGGKA
ncbi:MAG: hypothetical protein NT137_00160 [Methanomassiliicoccales archaeon]|nr:hypothetical protein [Methanomassiliicoccales archaeon]